MAMYVVDDGPDTRAPTRSSEFAQIFPNVGHLPGQLCRARLIRSGLPRSRCVKS